MSYVFRKSKGSAQSGRCLVRAGSKMLAHFSPHLLAGFQYLVPLVLVSIQVPDPWDDEVLFKESSWCPWWVKLLATRPRGKSLNIFPMSCGQHSILSVLMSCFLLSLRHSHCGNKTLPHNRCLLLPSIDTVVTKCYPTVGSLPPMSPMPSSSSHWLFGDTHFLPSSTTWGCLSSEHPDMLFFVSGMLPPDTLF